jgi:excisionase family DNA binding protein
MSNKNPNKMMYTLQDLAEKTGIGLQTWRKYAASGELKASKVGRSYLVWPHNSEEFIKSREVKPADKSLKS